MINLKKITVITFLLLSILIIFGGCGTEEVPDTLDISSDVDFAEDDYQKIVTANNKLGFKMLGEVEADGNGNSFISPLSLFMALSMVYNGADGVTKEEIAKTLQAEGIDVNELNQANASLLTMLNKDSDDIQLSIANSIWLNEDFHFQDDFAQYNQDYFNAEIQEIDISNSESPKMINDWVKKSTNERITEIVDDPLNPDLVTILINAIYFNGNWKFEFDEKLTEEGTFYTGDGVTENVLFMSLSEELQYMEDDGLQAVMLPYGDGEMSMKVFLPQESSDLETLEQRLIHEDWSSLNQKFQEKEGTIVLPKFQLEYEANFNEMLQGLGMNTAFDPEIANFTKMITGSDPVWISQVKQKTFIDVNEEGTEAAGATSIEMDTTSAPIDVDEPFYMEVNRPFFIMITDDDTEAILFMGSISNPIEGK